MAGAPFFSEDGMEIKSITCCCGGGVGSSFMQRPPGSTHWCFLLTAASPNH